MLLNIKFEIVIIFSKQREKFVAHSEFTIIGDEEQSMISFPCYERYVFPCYERYVRWKRREGVSPMINGIEEKMH